MVVRWWRKCRISNICGEVNAGGSGINCYFSSDGSAWTNAQEDYTMGKRYLVHLAITRDGSNVVHTWVNGTGGRSGTFTGTVADPAATILYLLAQELTHLKSVGRVYG